MIASEETQRIIRIAVARFINKWPHADPAEAQGVALDHAIQGTMDYIAEGGLSYRRYIERRIAWALSRTHWERWRRSQLTKERYEDPATDPDLNPDPWQMLGAMKRLQDQQAVVEAINALPYDHAYLIRQHYLKGRSVRSIAKELGKSATGAGRLHHDALTRLRVLLAKRGIEG